MWLNFKFQRLLKEVHSHTLLTPERLYTLYRLATKIRKSKESVNLAEVGVYKGGSAKLIAKSCPNLPVYLFDTFTGLPKTNNLDIHLKGDFSDCSLEKTKEYLADCPNAKIYKGFFPDSAKELKDLKFALVHIDCDLYQSTRDAIEFFYPRLIKAGVLIFDDYDWWATLGITQAIREQFHFQDIIISAPYQCLVYKK